MNHYPFRRDEYPDLTHTIRTVVGESHTRAQLEKLSTTRLRELKKTYEARVLKGDKDAARELADIRGLLRSKGAGHALDEASACERAAAARLKAANAEDLKEKPGAAGEKAHKRLHKTIKTVVGEGQEYTAALEAALLALCEELDLDPEDLVEDVMTAGRERQLSGKINRQAARTNQAYKKTDPVRDNPHDPKNKRRSISPARKKFEREYAKSKKVGTRYDREMDSSKVYGMGGKVLRGKDGKPLSQRAAKRKGLKLTPKRTFYGSMRTGSGAQRDRGGGFQDAY